MPFPSSTGELRTHPASTQIKESGTLKIGDVTLKTEDPKDHFTAGFGKGNALRRTLTAMKVSSKVGSHTDTPAYLQKPEIEPEFSESGTIKIGDVILKTEYPKDY